jgi:hypothetical protein
MVGTDRITLTAGHKASNEQINANKRRHLSQYKLGRSEGKGLRKGAGSSKRHGMEEVSEMKMTRFHHSTLNHEFSHSGGNCLL